MKLKPVLVLSLVAGAIVAFGAIVLSHQFSLLSLMTGFSTYPQFGEGARRLRIGEQRFEIPNNYFGLSEKVEGHDGDYRIVRAAYLIGLAPSFTPLTRDNEKEFHKPLCCFRVLIKPIAILPSRVLPRIIKSWLDVLEIVRSDREGRYDHYEVRSPTGYITLSEFGDIYIRDDQQEAISCNRRDTTKGKHLVNVQCTVYTADKAGLYEITLPGNSPVERTDQLDTIWKVIRSWRR